MDYELVGRCIYGHQRLVGCLEALTESLGENADESIAVELAEVAGSIRHLGEMIRQNTDPATNANFDFAAVLPKLDAAQERLVQVMKSSNYANPSLIAWKRPNHRV